MEKRRFKRGDTFLQSVSLAENNVPVDLTGWTARSHVRLNGTLIDALDVEYTNPPQGLITLRKNITTHWPIKVLECDVEFTTSTGQVTSSETFLIQCQADITI